jgi:hypothetical protein
MSKSVRFVFPGDPLYPEATALVRRMYQEVFGATNTKRPPCFIACEDVRASGSSLISCVAVTRAGDAPLFSERYLDASVDVALTAAVGQLVSRSMVAEVGSLASIGSPGAAAEMLSVAPWMLWCAGFRYALITATAVVRRIMARAKIRFHPLCPARIDCLDPAEREAWGSYYRAGPVTGWVDLTAHAVAFADGDLARFPMRAMSLEMPLPEVALSVPAGPDPTAGAGQP